MASGLFGKWFGAQQGLAPQVKDALEELAKLTQPSLATACLVLRDILLVLFEVGSASQTGPELKSRSARGTHEEKLAGGIPLLRGETLPIDRKTMRHHWLAVCKAIERQNGNAKAVAASFDNLDPSTLLTEVLAGRPEAVPARAEILHLDPPLTATILRFVALPFLAPMAADLAPLRERTPWHHGNCPTCGSWPLLGEFRGLEQIRYLRCGLCASDWEFPRLRCPFCDNQDHRRLGYFHVEAEENRYRAATCDECHGYVKIVSTLASLSEPHLLVTDLATLHLDLAAADRGYWVP